MSNPSKSLTVKKLDGPMPYGEASELQLELVEKRKEQAIGDTLLILEHNPVITLGRSAKEAGVVASQAVLSDMGIEVHRTERGGQATYHGPGQIVGYPIVNLHDLKMGAAKYVWHLEESIILAAKNLGVDAKRINGLTGVFCGRGKIGAVGVRITKGIAYHGFAFNIAPNLQHYQLLVPCGLTDTPVASIQTAAGKTVPMDAAKETMIAAFVETFGYENLS